MNSVHDIAKATIQVLDYTGDLVKKAEDQRIHLLEQMDIWSTQLAELSAMFQKLQAENAGLRSKLISLEKERSEDLSWTTACHYRDQVARAKEFILARIEPSSESWRSFTEDWRKEVLEGRT